MKDRVKAPSARPTEGAANRRSLLRHASVTRAFSASKGTAAPSTRRLGSLLALAICALALSAAPALAAEATAPTLSNGSYASVDAAGEVDVDGFGFYAFQYSTDETNWTVAGDPEIFFSTQLEAVSRPITGLKGGTKYFFRLAVYNECCFNQVGESPAPNPYYTTLPVDPPAVLSIDDVADASYTTATASGEVERPANPDHAFDAHCRFEYVTDQQFGENGFQGALRTPCNVDPVETPEAKPQVEAKLTELAPATTYHLRLSAENAGGTVFKDAATFTTLAVAAPSVSIDPVATFTGTGAHLSGKVNPNGADPAFNAAWHFACVPDCGEPGDIAIADGTEHLIGAELVGLEPNSAYEVRLFASNLGGPSQAGPVSLQTLKIAPSVQTAFAEDVEANSATLTGKVNPHNSTTTYAFEYGLDRSYGTTEPIPTASLGAIDNVNHPVSLPLSSLQEASTYHFRLTATNTETGETTYGVDHTFATGPAANCANQQLRAENNSLSLPDCRAYEQVSPLNKYGYDAGTTGGSLGYSLATADGDGVLYASRGPIGDAQRGLQEYTTSRRSAGGWSSGPATPPGTMERISIFPHLPYGLLPSSDLSTVVFSAYGSYVPGNPDTGQLATSGALYMGHEDGAIDWLTEPQIKNPVPAPGNYYTYALFQPVGAAPDLSTVYFWAGPTLVSADAARASGNGWGLYEYSGGELKPAGTLPPSAGHPDGTEDPGGAAPASTTSEAYNNYNFTSPEKFSNQVSRDGSTLFFVSPDPSVAPLTQLYVRRDGHSTLVSHGPDGTPAPSGVAPSLWLSAGNGDTLAHQFAYGSADGNSAIFQSTSVLAPNAPPGSSVKAYRYNVQTDTVTYLPGIDQANATSPATVVAASDDGSRFLFGDRESSRIAVWDDGVIKPIASLAGSSLVPRIRPAAATASGSVFIFSTAAPIPGFNSGAQLQIYRYDVGPDQLSCLSCPADSVTPTGAASLAGLEPAASSGELISSRFMSEDGDRVFFNSPEALVPQDTNGVQDVYEWTPGGVSLISSGHGTDPSYVLDNSTDGDDVFFATAEGLDPKDNDEGFDVYDARVGGGFSQAPSLTPCEGNDPCKGLAPPPPPQSTPATNSADATRTPRLEVGAGKLVGGELKLKLTVPVPGSVLATAKGTKRTRHAYSKAGAAQLTLPLTPASKKSLRKRRRLTFEVHLRFSPSAGEPSSANVVLTVKG